MTELIGTEMLTPENSNVKTAEEEASEQGGRAMFEMTVSVRFSWATTTLNASSGMMMSGLPVSSKTGDGNLLEFVKTFPFREMEDIFTRIWS